MLTKEKCEEVLETLKNVTCMGKNVYGSIVNHPYDKSVDCFEQLINEHFELKEENSQLRFDCALYKSGMEEASDHCDIFLEEIKKLEKALDKACSVMTNRVNINNGNGIPTINFTKEQWKEWALNGNE